MTEKYLIINPGSTSTKLAIFSENEKLVQMDVTLAKEDTKDFDKLIDQTDLRYNQILTFLAENDVLPEDITTVVGRGGVLKPIAGGTYKIDDEMLVDLHNETYGVHASNLGAILANKFAESYGIDAYTVDPVVVDELSEVARVSGLKGIERRSVFHALNQKAAARSVVDNYDESTAIVAHIGGGVSVGLHYNGKIVDVTNALDGEGPMSPARTGDLPLVDFVEYVLDERMTIGEAKSVIAGKGGLYSYLGETDIRVIQERIDGGDEDAKLYLDAMIYQIAKSIGSYAPVVNGNVDVIVLTGGASYSEYITDEIEKRVSWIAPVQIVPGELEMQALYEGAKRVVDGIEQAKHYAEQ